MFEATGKIDKHTLKELKRYMIEAKRKVIILVSIVVFTFLSVISALMQEYTEMFAFVIIAIILFAQYHVTLNRSVKIILERMNESTGRTEAIYRLSFQEDEVTVLNTSTEAKGKMGYDVFVKFIETKSVYALCTRSWQFIVVSKDCLNERQRGEFIDFLKSKCTGVKWRS